MSSSTSVINELHPVFPYNAFFIGSALLMGSALQWWLFQHVSGIADALYSDFGACLLAIMAALVIIVLLRQMAHECCMALRLLLAFGAVELITIGAGCFLSKATLQGIMLSILIATIIFVLFVSLGFYIINFATHKILFLGVLGFWTLLGLLSCLLALTLMLSLVEMNVSYVKALSICAYPALFCSIVYDIHKITDKDLYPYKFRDQINHGLYLYAEYVGLLVATVSF